jgi:death on curing protein
VSANPGDGTKAVGLLDAAVNRPGASAFGDDAYRSLDLKAAARLHSLTNNHALIDANTWLAWLATVVFCDLNGSPPEPSDDEALQVVWDIASSDVDGAGIASRLNLLPLAMIS